MPVASDRTSDRDGGLCVNSGAAGPLLARGRKLLAKAEDVGVTPAEAQALTAKAAELMAKSGIDRALLAAARPETDRPADRVIDVGNPWARVQAHLLCGLASAMRCQCVILPRTGPGSRIHVFGFSSDIERTDVLYTSLLVQMWQGLAAAQVPDWSPSPPPWGPGRRWSRARKMASVPCRCGQNCAYRPSGSGHLRSGTSASTAGASRTATSSRPARTSATTARVSPTCGEHVT